MPERNGNQSILEAYRGKIVPIYVFCEFNDLEASPVLGKVNPDTYKIAESSVKDGLRKIAHQHYVQNQRHTDYSLAVMFGSRNNPTSIIMLKERFRF